MRIEVRCKIRILVVIMHRFSVLAVLIAFSLCLPLQGKPDDVTPQPTQSVEVTNPAPDTKIRDRIVGVFSQIEEFKKIEVSVQSGVVTLSGQVPSAQTRDDALALVRRTEGVVMAVDRQDEPADVTSQLSPAVESLKQLRRAITTKLPLIGIALLIGIVFIAVANFINKRDRWFRRLGVSSLRQTLIRRLVRVVIIGIGVVLALEVLNATAAVGAVLGAAGLVGIAIGFAFQNILENYLSGILLSTRNPFEIGDVIEIKGQTGKVALLTARDTVLVTLDGNHLRIPNSMVINSELLNLTRNPLRRFEFMVGVSVDIDLSEARKIGLAALAKNPGVLAEPKPILLIDNLGDSTVNMKCLAWLNQTTHDFYKTRSQAIRMVKEAFDDAGLEMPEPIYRIHIRDTAPSSPSGETSEKQKPRNALTTPDLTIPEEDLSADHTIDKQVAEEQRQSKEENLLSKKQEDA